MLRRIVIVEDVSGPFVAGDDCVDAAIIVDITDSCVETSTKPLPLLPRRITGSL